MLFNILFVEFKKTEKKFDNKSRTLYICLWYDNVHNFQDIRKKLCLKEENNKNVFKESSSISTAIIRK